MSGQQFMKFRFSGIVNFNNNNNNCPSPAVLDSLGPPLHSAAGVPRDVRSASFPTRTCADGPCPAVPPSGNLAFSAVVHGLLLELDV